MEIGATITMAYVITNITRDNDDFLKEIVVFDSIRKLYPNLDGAITYDFIVQDLGLVLFMSLSVGILMYKLDMFKTNTSIKYASITLGVSFVGMVISNMLNMI